MGEASHPRAEDGIVAPTCSNCGGNEFVWSNELKTGTGLSGTGTLSLRPRGEIPLGTRICRSCGHADLFLRDLTILQKPHTWRPGEFIPIQSKPRHTAPTPAPHSTGAGHSHVPPAEAATAPPPPPPTPLVAPAAPMTPPSPPEPMPEPEPVPEPMAPPELEPAHAPSAETVLPSVPEDAPGTEPPAAPVVESTSTGRTRTPRKRGSKKVA